MLWENRWGVRTPRNTGGPREGEGWDLGFQEGDKARRQRGCRSCAPHAGWNPAAAYTDRPQQAEGQFPEPKNP